MPEQLVIRPADLSNIEHSLRQLTHGIGSVEVQVNQVGQEVVSLDGRLNKLAEDFDAFLEENRRSVQLQLAEMRLVKTRQEIETNFGHYGDVRRRTTGILQAADVGIVRQERILSGTEDLMLAAPRYWLAPGLVSLAAWLGDDPPLAERAVKEAMNRNPHKTSLFFALITRRLARLQASSAWLDYYFTLQNPTALDREAVILIDGLASGIFGLEARGRCSQAIAEWMEILSERVGFVEEQKVQWERALLSKAVPTGPEKYTYLKTYSPAWDALQRSMNGARLYQVIANYFQTIFSGEIMSSPTILVAVDDLLDKLVSRYDDDELPLRVDERLQKLIIEEQGDKKTAEKRADLEKGALEEKISFTQLLTNAAMHPETSHASRATQRYAVALSRDWITQAFNDVVAQSRAQVPSSIALLIENWQGVTQDGANEADLIQSLNAEMDRRCQKAVDQVKIGAKEIAAAAFGGLLLLFGCIPHLNLLMLILGAGCFVYFGFQYKTIDSRKARVRQEFADLKSKTGQILRGTLAEVVDWRREYREQDAQSKVVIDILDSVSPEQYTLSSHDTSRAVLINGAKRTQ